VTWNPQSSGTSARLTKVAFPTRTDGLIVGADGTVLTTTDSGATWTPQDSGVQRHLWGLAFVGSAYAWAVGDVGTIRRRECAILPA
jgi:photosystem II stability/assembly factor-like uncharacterized protein